MRDIPMFTTEYGIASLTLKEIPSRQMAYISILASQQPKELLEACIGFCRACGAEKVYAQNHEYLECYPIHTTVVKMQGIARVDETKVDNLWPVTEETVSQWREFMNERLKDVDGAETLDRQSEREILISGAYFVHKDGQMLGAGWLKHGKLLLVAAKPGMGERVMHTLMSLQPDEPIELEVANTNIPAVRLYQKLGFLITEELIKWYKVF